MLLYPILCPNQHAELTSRGLLTARWRYVDRDRARAYRWMVASMKRRGIDSRGRPPVWAWHTFQSASRRKPDLRASYYLWTPGEKAVRLVIDVPDDLVLLSDFESWHAVLNAWYLSHSEAEDERIDALEKAGRLTRDLKQNSWERIFDLTGGDPDWNGSPAERSIQACLPYIRSDWVRETTPFTARGKASR